MTPYRVHTSALDMLTHLLCREGLRYTVAAPDADGVHDVSVPRHEGATAWHDAPMDHTGQYRLAFVDVHVGFTSEIKFEWRSAYDRGPES